MSDQSRRCDRRSFLEKSIHVSGAGVLAALSFEQGGLPAQAAETATAKATVSVSASAMPTGAIGKLRVGRLICGGNLFAGSAHSRDLIYVSELMKHYYTPEKIMDTLELCESCGVNTVVMRCDDHIIGVLKRYRTQRGGKIQWIAQTYPKVNDLSNIQKAIDAGAAAVFAQGGYCDDLVKDGHLDTIVQLLALVEKNGLPAGVGSHSLTDAPACREGRPVARFLPQDLQQGRVRVPGGCRDRRFHEGCPETVDRLQSTGRRGHSAARRPFAGLQDRRRFRQPGDVRFPGQRRRQDRDRPVGRRPQAGSPLAVLRTSQGPRVTPTGSSWASR